MSENTTPQVEVKNDDAPIQITTPEITSNVEVKNDVSPNPQPLPEISSTVEVKNENTQPSQEIVEIKVEITQKEENKQSIVVNVPAVDIELLAKEGLDKLIEKYLDDGAIDNDELVDIVKVTMEIVENKKEITGLEKKRMALLILRKFIQDKVKDYDSLEKLFDKSIDLAVKVSKDGLETIKFNSTMIGDTKSAFNLIYSSTMSKIDEKYPLADDIINNIFDIALYIVQLMEGQTALSDQEKKVLLKKILTKVINSLDSKLNEEQRNFLIVQIDPTISLVQIGIRAQNGKFEINPQEVMGFFACITACFRQCCKKKTSQK